MAKNEGTARTPEEFRSWLRSLREAAGLSQEELAAAVGTDRRNIRRWEAEGYDPAGTVLLRMLSALGVRIEPDPRLPGPVNAELRALARQLDSERDLAASRQDELRDRIAGLESQLRRITSRLQQMESRRE